MQRRRAIGWANARLAALLGLAGCPGVGTGAYGGGSSEDGDSETEAPGDDDDDDDDDDATSTGSGSGDGGSDTGGETGDTGSDDGTDGGSTGQMGDGCTPFPAAADFAEAGPFGVTSDMAPGCQVFRPATLGNNGLRHPVILWGNGTATTVGIYQAVLEHWASHGFVVAAATTSNAGSGTEMLACLDWVIEQSEEGGSEYAGAVDLTRVGASGHSQGGGGSLMAGADPRVTTTAPLQPYTQQGFGGYDQAVQSMQTGPMFLMSGAADSIAPIEPNQQRVFDDTNVPTFWGILAGANHIITAIGDIDGYRGPSTAWFRYHLMCDDLARPLFYDACTLCNARDWSVQTKNW